MGIYKGSGAITREQFLYHETRIVARLMVDDSLADEEILQRVIEDNLFQFPTEKSLKRTVSACLRRLSFFDENSINAIAHKPMEVSKQICLYAMMKQYRLVWDFMITVIGEKYRVQNLSYGRMDLNVFFMRLQEQDEEVAAWSESTINKIKQVLNKILVENGYLDSIRATSLNPVFICTELENSVRANGDEIVLPAFNCF